MKKQPFRIYLIAAIAGLLLAIGRNASPQQSGLLGIRDEAADQLVQLGDPVAFTVSPVAGGSYQWLRNGSPINGQTGSALTFASAQIADAGYYSCNITTGISTGLTIVPTVTASLMVYTLTPDFLVVVYAQPITSSGNQGPCPGPYKGYVNYTKTVAQGWGWTPSTNTTTYTASDTTRTNSKIEYLGGYGDSGCINTSITVPYPTFSPAYRFTIIFTNNVPTTNYPITLTGFNP